MQLRNFKSLHCQILPGLSCAYWGLGNHGLQNKNLGTAVASDGFSQDWVSAWSLPCHAHSRFTQEEIPQKQNFTETSLSKKPPVTYRRRLCPLPLSSIAIRGNHENYLSITWVSLSGLRYAYNNQIYYALMLQSSYISLDML